MAVPTVADAPGLYAAVRSEMIEWARGLDDAEAAQAVPMCPGWSVKDVYAHVVGINADFLSGNIEGIGTDAWTAAQVDQRREWTLQQVVGEWEDLRPRVDAAMAEQPGLALRAGADLTAHRLDVLSTLGRDDERNGPSTQMALVRYCPEVMRRVADAGLPILSLSAGDQDWVSADGAVAVSLSTTPFELFRVLTGRRSTSQVAAMAWIGDPAPYVELLSPYGLATEALVE